MGKKPFLLQSHTNNHMNYPLLPRCAFSALDSRCDPRIKLNGRFSYLPKRLAMRRFLSYGETPITVSNRGIAIASSQDKKLPTALSALRACSPFGKRTAKNKKKYSCQLTYWCPHCWVRRRTAVAYRRLRPLLLNANGNPINPKIALFTVRREHQFEIAEIPVDPLRRSGMEFECWAQVFMHNREQFDRIPSQGYIMISTCEISIEAGIAKYTGGNLVYRLTPVTTLIGITPRRRLDDLLESLSKPTDAYVTKTSAASVLDNWSFAQQVAIATRYPDSWNAPIHWPMLPDLIREITACRMYSTFGCLRKGKDDVLTPTVPQTAAVANPSPPIRVSGTRPGSRFLPKSPTIREPDHGGD